MFKNARNALVALFAVLFCANVASAQQAKAFKVGYVNLARIVAEVNEAKAARAKLQSDFQKKQAQLDQLQKDFEKQYSDFERGKAMMKPEAQAEQQKRLQDKYMEMQQTLGKLQNELAEQEAEIAQRIHGKIRNIVEAIGDRDGYDLIIDNSEVKATVLFYKRHLDLTDQVINQYNKNHPATVPAASSANKGK